MCSVAEMAHGYVKRQSLQESKDSGNDPESKHWRILSGTLMFLVFLKMIDLPEREALGSVRAAGRDDYMHQHRNRSGNVTVHRWQT